MNRFISLKWWIRFIKFNAIGIIPFLIATPLFLLLFPTYGAWAWLMVNAVGAATHFLLIEFFNKHNYGFMFHEPNRENLPCSETGICPLNKKAIKK